ncbi:hypothetical protein TESG_08410 [Trichophyton tonsurans CBS 112818]|uniref:Reverse transcriptase RNase H-like domain-containing protein n=1 Tax=Trichophyton tonsurans (strain CBS 112818) TaxID=647933 RepID=F2RWQ9_TRIT1|nr:hypothetical protein TESG_08410 [Trichophyton tonsurans CBS 112818]
MALAECNYLIYNKEILAIIRALKEWRVELANRRYELLEEFYKEANFIILLKDKNGFNITKDKTLKEYLNREIRPGIL